MQRILGAEGSEPVVGGEVTAGETVEATVT